MFKRILIANRGEIACRIIETCRRLGIETVAVYSEADRAARHVRLADRAVAIGPAEAGKSYLVAEKVIETAQQTGAQAVHPGYGFLSENAGFARALADAGIALIGPKPETIDAMGSKARAKAIMADAGVPLVPGYHGDDQDDDTLVAEAGKVGFPLMLKAAAGGGGKGMRIVRSGEDFTDALAAARRESTSAFGDN
ncbi:MAG: biotin carboxylase N-terminal domain-containing protein, partial [Wenzhouxiangellaceae bacterium]